MRYQLIAILLIASVSAAQSPSPLPQSANGPAVAAPDASSATVTVASGTKIPLTLVSVIKSLSTKPGDTVRAVVAFPVTVGSQIAIPAGTYVEGVVTAINPKARQAQSASLQIHFTRLLYANGYVASLDAENTMAIIVLPGAAPQTTYEIADARAGAPILGDQSRAAVQTEATTPSVPQVGPNPVTIVVPIVGGFAALLVGMLIWVHHSVKNTDFLLYGSGWQFQMELQTPLTLDVSKVSAAMASPSASNPGVNP